MTHDDMPAYGLWSLVLINSAIFIFFAFSFFKPKTTRDWRTFGTLSAFILALLGISGTTGDMRTLVAHEGSDLGCRLAVAAYV